jgi:hypothetical protein
MDEQRIQKIEKILAGGANRLVLRHGFTSATIPILSYLILYGLRAAGLFNFHPDPVWGLTQLVFGPFIFFLMGCYQGSFLWHRLIKKRQEYYEQKSHIERSSAQFK